MKKHLWLMFCCLSLTTSVFAVNHHFSSQASPREAANGKMITEPGFCEIEIINQSNFNLVISGHLENGAVLKPFHFPFYDAPHYVSAYSKGRCYPGMYIKIDTLTGYPVFYDYVYTYQTLYVFPFGREAKAKVSAK